MGRDSTPSNPVLKSGSHLGPYEILAPLGAGGMGEVYQARDVKLRRFVAIKVLPRAFVDDPERLARFQREARMLASLNHPHIATIHGLEESGGVHFLVMEFITGETLAERLRNGPLPIERVFQYSIELATALDNAHRNGITHRDLKPGNIMLTKTGTKLLDFGLAKTKRDPAVSDTTVSALLSGDESLTAKGAIVGTLQYMAPEQLEGNDVDARTDIFAFGAVVYEMATAKKAFEGSSQASLIAKILETDPPPISSLQPVTPPALDRAVRKCLAKEPEKRWQAISDVCDELQWIAEGGSQLGSAPALPAKSVRGLGRRQIVLSVCATLLAALFGAAAAWLAKPAPPSPAKPLTRLNVDLGPKAMTGLNLTVAISPDGRRLVFPARGPNGQQQLAMLPLDQAEPTFLPGTEGGATPFFSPDGRWIGFFAYPALLKKISVQGGAPVTLGLVSTNVANGATWGEDGNIIAAAGVVLPLWRYPASGGEPQPITKLGPGEVSHRWPQVLPGGNAVLFTASPSASAWDNATIEAVSLKTGERKILVQGGYYGRYVPNGYLVYVRQGTLFGVKFDPEQLEVSGTPTPLVQDVASNPATGGGQFDVSLTGTLVYSAGKSAAEAWELSWLDASGKIQPLLTSLGTYNGPRVSPDGRKLAFEHGSDIYVYDLQQETTTRLTFTGHTGTAVWAPDSKHILFLSQSSDFSFYWIRSDGSGDSQLLLETANTLVPWSFSPDGRQLAYRTASPDTAADIWTLPLDLTDPDHPKPGKPQPFLVTPANELVPSFSPDGRWIAYRSDESGSDEIYVRPFPPGSGARWQVSSGGGLYALWSNDGRQLFYEAEDNRIMVVDYAVHGAAFVPGKPRLWCDKQIFFTGASNLDLAPDGKRFAVLTLPEATGGQQASVHVTMIENFFDEVKRKIP